MQAVQGRGPLLFKNVFSLPDTADVTWEKFRPGIEAHYLYRVPEGPTAAMLRYAPGASLQRHVHVGYEHIFVLAGSQADEIGEVLAGQLRIHPPGSSHSVVSKSGCIVLAIHEHPVSFLAASGE